MEIKGVIFDMDGVILDSEKLYVKFWTQAGRECGYPFEEKHALAIRSLFRPFAIERLRGFFGEFDYDRVRDRRIEIMDEYVSENGIDLKPYASETIEALKNAGFRLAVATATPPERTKRYLGSSGLYSLFDRVVCAAEVKKGKPEPDIYIHAAEALGLKSEQCAAVEDSPNGVLSAYRAGCRAIMIPDLDKPDENTRKLAFAVLDSLKELREMLV